MIPVVLFVRVSSISQNHTRQINDLKSVAQKNNWNVVSTITTMISASKKRRIDQQAYLKSLSDKYIVLKNRVSGILKIIEFDSNSSERFILEAVKFYQMETSGEPPLTFLSPEEYDIVLNSNGSLNVALYKVLLYLYISEAIKSGALNIKYSYKYLSIEDYLIPRAIWETEKKVFLERAGLLKYKIYRHHWFS